MNLHRLIYTSSRRSKCNDAEIQKILEAAQRNNLAQNITGVLLHTRNRFLQYLEGDGGEIMRLYEKIKNDDRHGGSMIRDFSPIRERVFPSWHMGYKDLSDKMTFNTDMTLADHQLFEELLEGKLEKAGDIKVKVVKRFFEVPAL